jgi:hypothetical protein
VFTANSRVAKVVLVKFVVRPRLCAGLCETTKQEVNLSVHQNADVPVPKLTKLNSVVLVRKRNLPTERPPLSAK